MGCAEQASLSFDSIGFVWFLGTVATKLRCLVLTHSNIGTGLASWVATDILWTVIWLTVTLTDSTGWISIQCRFDRLDIHSVQTQHVEYPFSALDRLNIHSVQIQQVGYPFSADLKGWISIQCRFDRLNIHSVQTQHVEYPFSALDRLNIHSVRIWQVEYPFSADSTGRISIQCRLDRLNICSVQTQQDEYPFSALDRLNISIQCKFERLNIHSVHMTGWISIQCRQNIHWHPLYCNMRHGNGCADSVGWISIVFEAASGAKTRLDCILRPITVSRRCSEKSGVTHDMFNCWANSSKRFEHLHSFNAVKWFKQQKLCVHLNEI